jgi:hypothetical protein
VDITLQARCACTVLGGESQIASGTSPTLLEHWLYEVGNYASIAAAASAPGTTS